MKEAGRLRGFFHQCASHHSAVLPGIVQVRSRHHRCISECGRGSLPPPHLHTYFLLPQPQTARTSEKYQHGRSFPPYLAGNSCAPWNHFAHHWIMFCPVLNIGSRRALDPSALRFSTSRQAVDSRSHCSMCRPSAMRQHRLSVLCFFDMPAIAASASSSRRLTASSKSS